MRTRTLDLFSGIGGFSWAMKPICQTVAYCDIEPASRNVIQDKIDRNMLEDAPIYSDVCQIKKRTLRALKPTMITAGFPCTDISIANIQGEGLHGPRSKLFFEIIRIIDECPSPIKVVFLENSHAIVKRGFEDVQEAFHARGFELAWCIIHASDAGALHRRKRWYCIAYRPSIAPRLQLLPETSLTYPWNTEPCTRVIRKPKNKQLKEHCIMRCRMLGNSIVPQCAAHAWNTLVQAIQVSVSQRQAVQNPIPVIPLACRKLQLVITDGEKTFRRAAWATPCYSIWHIYSHITSSRAKTVLTVQVFFEQRTRINTGDKKEQFRKYLINPRFVEYLMGYPLDWTNMSTTDA